MSDDEIVIGEGVVLEAATANIGSRIVAWMIDAAVVLFLLWGTMYGLSAALGSVLDLALFAAVITALTLVLFLFGPATVETLTRGRSLGKLALGIRVVRDDGGPVSFRHAFTRHLAAIAESWITMGSIAMLTSLVSSRGKRVGDMLAGTYVVNARAVRANHRPVILPPDLREWSTTVDIRRLPDGLALTARQFLNRAPAMHMESRRQFGEQLAARLSAYVAPLPPEPIHPEALIAAVLATRRDREYAIALNHQNADAAQSAGVQRLPFGVADIND